MSHAKATKEIGYSPRPIRITIEAIFKWFMKKEGLISAVGHHTFLSGHMLCQVPSSESTGGVRLI